ncbi:tRNA pseudouridine(55) synthase TruB [Kocuria sp. HSID16901]|uniref:tRNA pseudouridine(55) synthase TruB n=1 Tax=Kocuria sp. HSID16901 TaxID=2419505 RepID=UPI000AB628DE|nr:tRNA pseudouridine(55) synthase TruB [Kocuria sp. HSID16901]
MARRGSSQDGPAGLIVVDKPQGFTSHDVVGKMRRIAGTRRVGHAGTLDPMATGVLILGINQATKLLTWVTGEGKSYDATIRLGQSTVTDDAEGDVTNTADAATVGELSRSSVEAAVGDLTGEIRQVPSAVSAIKVNGVRSYARVRSGEDVHLEARPVTIRAFDIHDCRSATTDEGASVLDVDVSVTCSSGTYIRALARDLGTALGVGGHLTRLRRTSIGEVRIDDASTLEQLEAARDSGQDLPVLPLTEAAARLFRRRELTAEEATALSNGRWIEPTDDLLETGGSSGPNDIVPAEQLAAAYAPDGTLVALCHNQLRRGRSVAVPHLVFASGQRFETTIERGSDQ